MEIVNRNVDELKHVEGNTRLHSERQLREYVRSIEMFGQIRPLVIDENNVVLAGNGLLAALRMMGKPTVACHVVADLSEKQKKKLMLADNKIFQLGEDDAYAFEEALRELSGDIDIPGYSADILKSLASDLKTIDNLRDETAQTAEKKPRTPRKSKAASEQITCPHCGRIFTLEQASCQEKQSDHADTLVAQT